MKYQSKTTKTKKKSGRNNVLPIVIVLGLFLSYQFHFKEKWFGIKTDKQTVKTTTNNYSPDGNNCAVVSTTKPYSYPVEVCRDEFSSEPLWKARIKELKKAKNYDEFGNKFEVTVKYK